MIIRTNVVSISSAPSFSLRTRDLFTDHSYARAGEDVSPPFAFSADFQIDTYRYPATTYDHLKVTDSDDSLKIESRDTKRSGAAAYTRAHSRARDVKTDWMLYTLTHTSLPRSEAGLEPREGKGTTRGHTQLRSCTCGRAHMRVAHGRQFPPLSLSLFLPSSRRRIRKSECGKEIGRRLVLTAPDHSLRLPDALRLKLRQPPTTRSAVVPATTN